MKAVLSNMIIIDEISFSRCFESGKIFFHEKLRSFSTMLGSDGRIYEVLYNMIIIDEISFRRCIEIFFHEKLRSFCTMLGSDGPF